MQTLWLSLADNERAMNERALTTAELIRAGSDFRLVDDTHILVVPKKIQARIAKIGNVAYEEISSRTIDEATSLFRAWYRDSLANTDINALSREQALRVIEKAKSLGATDTKRLERHLRPLRDESNALRNFMDITTVDGLVSGVQTAIEKGLAYRKEQAQSELALGKMMHDSRLDD